MSKKNTTHNGSGRQTIKTSIAVYSFGLKSRQNLHCSKKQTITRMTPSDYSVRKNSQ